MSVLFLFIDGVGLGAAGNTNPFDTDAWSGFMALSGGQRLTDQAAVIKEADHLFKPVDACLGVDGLPQSGTGQAALFSGENAPELIGKHFGPFPHSGNKHLLKEKSLFKNVQEDGSTCVFMNAYPDVFFEKARKRNRWSCTTLMTKSAGLPLFRASDVKEGTAVTAELTQQAWRDKLGLDVPVIELREAAGRLLKAMNRYDVVLHEYYLTDKAGHSQKRADAERFIARYDQLLQELVDKKSADDTLVLCSDHGNIEDLSIKTHTLNPVPLCVLGPGAMALHEATSIMDVVPGIRRMLRR